MKKNKCEIHKQLLYDLYIKENKTRKEVAEIFQCSTITISRYLKKYDIQKNMSYKRFINQTFNYLTIIDFDNKRTKQTDDNRIFFFCKCVCGKIVSKRGDHIISGGVRSCGCQHPKNQSGNKNPGFKGYEKISGVLWYRIKNGAKIRNIEFNITIQYIWELFGKQNGKCAISGLELYFSETYDEFLNRDTTASLDRIDSNKGYIEDNVQWVHKKINKMKMELNQQEFIKLCKIIGNNNP